MADVYRIPSTDVRVEELPKVGRIMRRPTHNFITKQMPFAVAPFMIAPVLPGETLKNLLVQASVITDPVVSAKMGWWHEMYFFYVKLRDLTDRTTIENMLLTNAAAPAATAATARNYYAGEGVDWVGKCTDRIVETYFRSEEEVANAFSPTIENYHQSKMITVPGWMESARTDLDAPASDGTPLPGDYWPEIPAQYVGTPFEAAYTQWKDMQSMELTPPTFEDYLKTFGIKPPPALREEKHVPELIRYVRTFKKPSNTISSDGTMNSQVVWDVAERADKDRFFAEPGFIIGLQTTRAKMYHAFQRSAMSCFLDDAFAWLPALLRPDPFTSLKKFAFGGSGPLDQMAEDYWVDLADLLHGGDQFIGGMDTSEADNSVLLPDDGGAAIKMAKDYATFEAVSGMFKVAASRFVRTEGRVDLGILSAVQDSTP